MTNIPHDSASKHVSGESVYIDDMLVNEQLLHGHIFTVRMRMHASNRSIHLQPKASRCTCCDYSPKTFPVTIKWAR
ncbi:MAG: hypothetical protein IPG90_03890 [Bacteroidetes bacterium]|nr:hypothetical protein [Bacteroidota bacterium]